MAGRRRSRRSSYPAAGARGPRRPLRYGHTDVRTCSSAPRARRLPRGSRRRACWAFLAAVGVTVHSHVLQIGSVRAAERESPRPATSPASTTRPRRLDPEAAARMVDEIDRLRKDNETLGGTFEVVARGSSRAPACTSRGTSASTRGSHRRRSRSRRSRASRSVRAWEVAGRPGLEAHDEIFLGRGARLVLGDQPARAGSRWRMTNGEPSPVVRAAMKPLSTPHQPLRTVDTETRSPRRHCASDRPDHRPRRGRRRSDGRSGAGGRLPRQARRRPHRRCSRRAHGVRERIGWRR